MVSKKKICVVTGARSEYGLLKGILELIRDSSQFDLFLLATGMHLAPEFGLTYKSIESDGFCIEHKVEMLMSSDTPQGITKSLGVGLIGFADVFERIKPDLLLILGDRFEIFSAAIAAAIARIPIAHIHGGELTEGLIDESIRHSITKISHLHFVAAEEYRRRVIQMGENPQHVFLVGGLGVDKIAKTQLLSKLELETSLNIRLPKKSLLVTFHPVTLEESTSEHQIKELLLALKERPNLTLIFTMPNADTDGRVITNCIKNFVLDRPNAYFFTSLGEVNYLSMLSLVGGVLGNSSSALLEAPSFQKGAINIGDRQKGRLQASSVINAEPNADSIVKAIDYLFSAEFQGSLGSTSNPYGVAGASEKIFKTLTQFDFSSMIKKKFNDWC